MRASASTGAGEAGRPITRRRQPGRPTLRPAAMVRAGSGEWRASTSAEVRSRPGAPRPSARTPSPLTASAHFAVSFTELGRTPARNRFKGLSGHSPVGLCQPRRDSPPQEAPGRPTSTDINRHRHAAERSAKSSSGVAECPAGHRAGSPRRAPRRPASSQFLYQGSPPRSLSETARVRSRACRIFRFTPASAIDTASCRSS